MPATPIPTIPAAPPVPNSLSPEATFDAQYEAFNRYEAETLVPALNAAIAALGANAAFVEQVHEQLEQLTTGLLASAAAQLSGGNGVLWVPGGSYTAATTSQPASVVLDPADVSVAYRCKADVSGSNTPPAQDPDHWVRLNGLSSAVQERVLDLGAGSALDMSRAAVFRKTITGSTTFSLVNPADLGFTSSGVLEITNGGAHAVTLWPGSRWTNGVVPTLTVAGTDVLGFYTSDGGGTTIWTPIALNVG